MRPKAGIETMPAGVCRRRAGDHDLRDIGRRRIVDGARAGDRGERRERADAGPAVATGAGALEYLSCRAHAGGSPPSLGEAGAGGASVAGRSDEAIGGTLRTIGDQRVDVRGRQLAEALVDRLAHRACRRAAAGRVAVRQIG